jgi:hypothetical protein
MKRAGLTVAFFSFAIVCSAAVPSLEDFDALTPGDDFIPAVNGWGADVTDVVVTAAESESGANSVNVNSGTISNNVDEVTPAGIVWTDFQLIPQLGVEPASPPTATANHIHYYGTNGLLNVYTLSGWVEVSEDIHGNALAAVDTNVFTRITIYQDFPNNLSALLLNGVVVLQDLAFPGTSDSYDTFEVQNVEAAPAYLDSFSANTSLPSNLTPDGNGNSTPDAQELHDNGYVARLFTVGEAGEDFASLSAAATGVRDGDTLIVTNVTGTLDGGGAANFTNSITITGVDFTTTETVTVAIGETLTIDGVAMDVDATATINGTLLVSSASGSFQATDATLGASGDIDSDGGTWGTDDPVVQMSGSFEIAGSAYDNANHAVALNFDDDFEDYAVGTVVSGLHFRGWGASDSASVIQNTKTHLSSGRAATISGIVSNRIDGGVVNKVWTDFWLCAAQGAEPASPATGDASALFYMTTNGFLAVYSQAGAEFIEASVNAAGDAVTPVETNTWTRISVFTQYDTDKAAIFMNDELLFEELDFPSLGATAYSLFSVESVDNDATLDDMFITFIRPTDLLGDVDGDDRPDSAEIQLYGNIGVLGPLASVFTFN